MLTQRRYLRFKLLFGRLVHLLAHGATASFIRLNGHLCKKNCHAQAPRASRIIDSGEQAYILTINDDNTISDPQLEVP